MHESGRDVTDLCRENNIHRSTIYTWKKKYGGLEVQELIRLKELEKEKPSAKVNVCAAPGVFAGKREKEQMIITAIRLVFSENPAIVEIYKKFKKKTQY